MLEAMDCIYSHVWPCECKEDFKLNLIILKFTTTDQLRNFLSKIDSDCNKFLLKF